jgi:PAS domain S-box-containing protein
VSGGAKPAPGRPAASLGGREVAFWMVFERSSNPIVVLDEAQRVQEANDAACALLGLPRAPLLGSSMIERFPPEDRAAAQRDWQHLLRGGDRVGERVLIAPDGSRSRVEWAARRAELDERTVIIAVYLRGSRLPEPRQVGTSITPLTRREREIVTLIAMGRETPEIAATLYISTETVRSHVRNAMRKLRARTRAQLVAVALSSGELADITHLEPGAKSPA